MKNRLVDTFGRVHRSLRLSVTDRCNLRCPYCMPAREAVFLPRREILAYEELEKLVRVGVRLGIRRVRVTGGEPLLRRDISRLVGRLAGIDGIQDLGLTTNGFRLKELSGDLRDAGLGRITVSLDTLRRDRFRSLAGLEGLDRVREGIEEARATGFSPVKVNTVLMRGVNEDEILDLAAWARDWGLQLRFIERMPVGDGSIPNPGALIPGREARARIERRFPLIPAGDTGAATPARMFRYADGRGEIGFINPVTEPFCAACDRVRITADGKIRNCLFDLGELDLRDPLRTGASPEALEKIWRRSVRNKGPGGRVRLRTGIPVTNGREMWQIGG